MFYESFISAYALLRNVGWSCFIELVNFKEPPANKTLLAPAEIEVVDDGVDLMSSLSLIHYFKQDCRDASPGVDAPVQRQQLMTMGHISDQPEDQVPKNKSVPSPRHEDTGLITLAVVSKVDALQILDRQTKQWLEVEKLYPPRTIIVWMGEKIPLFSGSSDFKATPHRVVLDKDKERTAMIFLLDVGK